jgi:hypothetical protein
MKKFNRAFLKEYVPELITLIAGQHVIGPEVYDELYNKHTPVVNLTHTRECFVIMSPDAGSTFYISYVMAHSIRNVAKRLLVLAVEEVTMYENYIEYETTRVKRMSAKSNKQTGLNLN